MYAWRPFIKLDILNLSSLSQTNYKYGFINWSYLLTALGLYLSNVDRLMLCVYDRTSYMNRKFESYNDCTHLCIKLYKDSSNLLIYLIVGSLKLKFCFQICFYNCLLTNKEALHAND